MTSKQRAHLRGLANKLEAILHIGKQGVTPEIAQALDEALEARELVKVAVLQNCPEEPADAAITLAGRTRAEAVQVIGRKVTLYRKAKEQPRIELPK
jgi:RNA-binding protein